MAVRILFLTNGAFIVMPRLGSTLCPEQSTFALVWAGQYTRPLASTRGLTAKQTEMLTPFPRPVGFDVVAPFQRISWTSLVVGGTNKADRVEVTSSPGGSSAPVQDQVVAVRQAIASV